MLAGVVPRQTTGTLFLEVSGAGLRRVPFATTLVALDFLNCFNQVHVQGCFGFEGGCQMAASSRRFFHQQLKALGLSQTRLWGSHPLPE